MLKENSAVLHSFNHTIISNFNRLDVKKPQFHEIYIPMDFDGAWNFISYILPKLKEQ